MDGLTAQDVREKNVKNALKVCHINKLLTPLHADMMSIITVIGQRECTLEFIETIK